MARAWRGGLAARLRGHRSRARDPRAAPDAGIRAGGVLVIAQVLAYRELEDRFRRMALLRSVEDILHWDTAAMMPA